MSSNEVAIKGPFMSMIRLRIPVFDAADRKRGFVLIDSFGQEPLNRLLAAEPLSEGKKRFCFAPHRERMNVAEGTK